MGQYSELEAHTAGGMGSIMQQLPQGIGVCRLMSVGGDLMPGWEGDGGHDTREKSRNITFASSGIATQLESTQ